MIVHDSREKFNNFSLIGYLFVPIGSVNYP